MGSNGRRVTKISATDLAVADASAAADGGADDESVSGPDEEQALWEPGVATSRWRPLATTLVSLCGLGLALFLTWGHYFDQAAITNSCPLGAKGSIINCGKVTTSAESVIFGIPVALLGALFFVFMVVVNLPVAWRSPSMWIARGRLVASVVGIGMVLYLISMEAFVIHAICIYCTMVHVVQFALFLLVVTGWEDTGWAAVRWRAEPEDGDEDHLEDEPEPLPEPARGNRPPRGKARRQAAGVRA